MTVDERTYNRMPTHLQALFEKLPNPGSDEVLAAFAAFGTKTSGGVTHQPKRTGFGFREERDGGTHIQRPPDTGTAARFFYCAKAPARERTPALGSEKHPTQKPLTLLRWLVNLACPPDGLVLDPFMGSGTTGVACGLEGRRFVGVEKDTEHGYFQTAKLRVGEAYRQWDGVKFLGQEGEVEGRPPLPPSPRGVG